MSLFSAFLLLFLLSITHCCAIKNRTIYCEKSSSCGDIAKISYPFRLHDDPKNCGNPNYELSCEKNTTVRYSGTEKYIVQSINYKNRTIRLVDDDLQKNNCSTLPRYSSLNSYLLPFFHSSYYSLRYIVFISCEYQLNSSRYIDTSPCLNATHFVHKSKSSQKRRYSYVLTEEFDISDVEDSCSVDLIVPSSSDSPLECKKKCSYSDIHNQMSYGIEFSWYDIFCEECNGYSCFVNENFTEFHCESDFYPKCGLACQIGSSIYDIICHLPKPIVIMTIVKFVCGFPFVVALLIYKWRRRHLSMYDTIEDFLQSHNNLMPVRYSFLSLQIITRGLREKLGAGGFGTVYKGKLRGGRVIAVKVLTKSKANGQDFINEVATIGRIHHVNVVQLIGFCADRSKRALIYDFMPNGSLDKYLFSKEGSISTNLSCEKMYEISLGVARGIEYLHRGCDIQILHFDIKPHNILLDENFTPKVSDFGLAKLYPTENSIVPLTGARGTMGYMAPELFYKNIGGISYKAVTCIVLECC